MRDVDTRADRYPADYALDDSRETIYHGRGPSPSQRSRG
jgi:hypothetical protein